MLLVWFKEPFLMRGKRSPILLIRASVEGARKDIAVEAHTGFKEGGGVLDAVANEGG
jgi:hypothetical protein